MSVSDVPLLNDYKKEFVKKRLPQTFLGGPNLRLGFTAPWYVYFLQILAWISPWIICGIFTILTEISGVNIAISACVAGGIIGLFVLSIQVIKIASCYAIIFILSAYEIRLLIKSKFFSI